MANNIESNKATRNAGELYKRIAAQYLMVWYPKMSSKERNDMLDFGNMEQLESMIASSDLIWAGIRALMRTLRQCIIGIEVPDDLGDIVFWSDTPNEDLAELTSTIDKASLSDEVKAHIAIAMVEEIHERWKIDCHYQFYKKDHEEGWYLFLPLELIGPEDAIRYYIFIDDILATIGLKVERGVFEQSYRERQRWYRDFYMLGDDERLAWFILNRAGQSEPAPVKIESILDVMENDDISHRIAEQVIKHSGEPSEW